MAADMHGTMISTAKVLAKQSGNAIKYLSRTGTVIGAIAGGAPAIYVNLDQRHISVAIYGFSFGAKSYDDKERAKCEDCRGDAPACSLLAGQ
jgi:hypothetical protein